LNFILEQKASIQKDYDQCMVQTQIVNEQMVGVSQSVTSLEQEINEGKNKYQEIKEFLDLLKQEELGVEELQKLINKLQSELITIKLSIEENESTSTAKQKLAKELEEKIATLDSEKDELESQIIRSQQVLEENPSAAILREWIDGIFFDIEDKREMLENRGTDKLRVEDELTSIAKALDFHAKALEKDTKDLQKDITQEETQVEQCRGELQNLHKQKIILENELVKESVEQLSADISSLTGENENLAGLEKGYREVVEQTGPTVVGLYHSIKKTSADLFNQIREIEQGLQEVKTRMEMTIQAMDNLHTDQQNTQDKLKNFRLSSEEYAQKIKESRHKESELRLETERAKQKISELKDELVKVDQGIIDYSQRESMEKQSFATYAFQDVFEFKDAVLNQEKEKNLSLLKYTILVVADEEELFPYSEHYHIPLNEYSPDNSAVPLPFGLSLKSNVSLTNAKKAVSWLRQISGCLSANGLIKVTTTFETEKNLFDNLLSKLSELKGQIAQLEKNLEDYSKKEEILKAQEVKYRGFQETVDSVKLEFKEEYDHQQSTLSFDLIEIISREAEFKQSIILFENSQKLLTETISRIEANTAQISKLESRSVMYRSNEAKLEKVRSDIQEWLTLLAQEEDKLASLKQGCEEKNTLLKTIERWINEFDKYFSRCPFYLTIENSLEEKDGVLSLEQTQAKAENLYLYERELNMISLEIDKITREMENLKLEQSRHSELLTKVLEAQKVVDRLPEKIRLVESITE
jgi:chromosome segregation ATPase